MLVLWLPFLLPLTPSGLRCLRAKPGPLYGSSKTFFTFSLMKERLSDNWVLCLGGIAGSWSLERKTEPEEWPLWVELLFPFWGSEGSLWEVCLETQEPLNKEFTHSLVILHLFSLFSPHNLSPNYVDYTPKYLSIHLLVSTLLLPPASALLPWTLASVISWPSCLSAQHSTGSFYNTVWSCPFSA